MNKQRLLALAVIVLLLLNGAVIMLLLRERGPQRHGVRPEDRPKMLVVERIGLDDDQVARYEVLIDAHRRAIAEKDKALGEARRALFEDLKATDAARRDSLVQVIATLQAEVERIHHAHFLEVRALCTPEQLPRFDALMGELSSFFGRSKPPGSRP